MATNAQIGPTTCSESVSVVARAHTVKKVDLDHLSRLNPLPKDRVNPAVLRPAFCYTAGMPEVKVLNEKLLAGLRPGTWVAISEDQERVVGTGTTIEEALQQAKEKGEKKPSIIGVPVDGSALIL